MKISNFLFNYLSIPLLPENNKTIKFLSLILSFSLGHRFFYKYLEICLRKRENVNTHVNMTTMISMVVSRHSRHSRHRRHSRQDEQNK